MDSPSVATSRSAPELTERQCEVLELVLEHKSNKEIARELGVSPSAVEQRLAAVRLKLGASRRGDLVRAYQEYRRTYADRTCVPRQVDSGARVEEDRRREGTGPVLELADSMPLHDLSSETAWSAADRPPREFRMPDSLVVRFAVIVGFAFVLAVTALVAATVAQSIADIVAF